MQAHVTYTAHSTHSSIVLAGQGLRCERSASLRQRRRKVLSPRTLLLYNGANKCTHKAFVCAVCTGVKRNEHFDKLQAGYLFPEVGPHEPAPVPHYQGISLHQVCEP